MPFNWVKRWRYLLLTGLCLVLVLGGTGTAWANLSRSFAEDGLRAYEITNLDADSERALGRTIHHYLQQDGLQFYDASSDLTGYVQQVGQRVASASDVPYPLTFQVVEDDLPNAFATVGGFIYVHTGLLREIRNEAELAGVLAHEMGHIQQRDGLNQLWLQLTTHQLARFERGMSQHLIAWGGRVRSVSNRHEDEYTADAIAFRLLGQTGYAQVGLLTLLERMSPEDEQHPSAPGLVSTHPAPRRRLVKLQTLWSTERTTAATEGQDEALYRSRVRALLTIEHSFP